MINKRGSSDRTNLPQWLVLRIDTIAHDLAKVVRKPWQWIGFDLLHNEDVPATLTGV
jgi:hypothetical protein